MVFSRLLVIHRVRSVHALRSTPAIEMNRRLRPGDQIDGRWIVKRRRATFWNWLEVKNKETGEIAMCNMTADHIIRFLPEYRFRACVIKEISAMGASCVPEFVSYKILKDNGSSPASYGCLFVKPFGPSLERLRNRLYMNHPNQNAKFSLFTCLHIGVESLRTLRQFHDAGYLQRPIEPNAFFLNSSSPVQNLLIVPLHFRRWRQFDSTSSTPISPRHPCLHPPWSFVSPPNSVPIHWRFPLRYASINVLRGNEPTRIDQLWSWFYMLFDLTLGPHHPANWLSDPWLYLTTIDRIIEGKELKHANADQWLRHTPAEYTRIFEYLRSSRPNDEPKYGRIIDALLTATRREAEAVALSRASNGDQDDQSQRSRAVPLDWESGGVHYDVLRPVLEDA